jgi:hypothetical protein
MEFCKIKNPPEYTLEVEHWTRDTDADGDQMAVVIEQLLNNTFYNKVKEERRQQPVLVNLPASGWSREAPYSQKVVVPGVKASDNPTVHPCTPKDLTPAEVKLKRKLISMITDGESEDDYVIFYCGEKRPTEDFSVYLRGVSDNG